MVREFDLEVLRVNTDNFGGLRSSERIVAISGQLLSMYGPRTAEYEAQTVLPSYLRYRDPNESRNVCRVLQCDEKERMRRRVLYLDAR